MKLFPAPHSSMVSATTTGELSIQVNVVTFLTYPGVSPNLRLAIESAISDADVEKESIDGVGTSLASIMCWHLEPWAVAEAETVLAMWYYGIGSK